MHGQFDLLAQPFVEAAEQGATACQIKTAAIDISGQFRRSGFQCFQDGFFYLEDALIEGFGDLLVGDHDLFGDTGDEVAAVDRDIIGGVVQVFKGGADLYFDLFGCSFPDLSHNERISVVIFQCYAGTADDAFQRIVGDVYG